MAAAWSTRIGWFPRPEKVLEPINGTVGRVGALPQPAGFELGSKLTTHRLYEASRRLYASMAASSFLPASSNRRSMAAF